MVRALVVNNIVLWDREWMFELVGVSEVRSLNLSEFNHQKTKDLRGSDCGYCRSLLLLVEWRLDRIPRHVV